MHFIKVLGSAKLTRWAYFVVCHFVACKMDHVHVTAKRFGPPLLNLFLRRWYYYCLVYVCLVLYLVMLHFDFNTYRAPLKIIQLLSGFPVKKLQLQ